MYLELEKTGCLAPLSSEGRAALRWNSAVNLLGKELLPFADAIGKLTSEPLLISDIKKTEEGVGPARVKLQAVRHGDGIHLILDHRCESDIKDARTSKNWFVDHRRTHVAAKNGRITEVSTGVLFTAINIMDADKTQPDLQPVHDRGEQVRILEAFARSVQVIHDPVHWGIRSVE